MCYFIPFVLQIVAYDNYSYDRDRETPVFTENKEKIIFINGWCMGITIIFFILDLIQLSDLKFEYFKQMNNIFDIFWYIL